ncbi:hypothetical protein ACVXZY_10650 [Staphylococcus aureus]
MTKGQHAQPFVKLARDAGRASTTFFMRWLSICGYQLNGTYLTKYITNAAFTKALR